MDKRTMSRLRDIKRRNFFSTLLKGSAAFFILNSFPVKLFGFGNKREEKIKLESNPLAVKRNKRG